MTIRVTNGDLERINEVVAAYSTAASANSDKNLKEFWAMVVGHPIEIRNEDVPKTKQEY
jgi:hypothetical protein